MKGFMVVGSIEASGAHRLVNNEGGVDRTLRDALLADAEHFVDTLEAKVQPHRHAEVILEETLSEIELGAHAPFGIKGGSRQKIRQGQLPPPFRGTSYFRVTKQDRVTMQRQVAIMRAQSAKRQLCAHQQSGPPLCGAS